MATRLRQLKITAVALCQQGKNPAADVLLYKSEDRPALEKQEAGMDAPQPETTAAIVGTHEAMEQLHRLKCALYESFSSIFEHAPMPEQPDLLLQSVTEFAALARQAIAQMGLLDKAAPVLTELATFHKAGRKISAARLARLKAALSALEAIIAEGDQTMPTEKGTEETPVTTAKTLDAQVDALTKRALTAELDARDLHKQLETAQAQLVEMTKQYDAAKAQAQTLQEQVDATDPEAVWKGVPPQQRARYEKMEEDLRTERQIRLKAENIQKAARYKGLPIKPDDDYEHFQAISELPGKTQRWLEMVLKAGDEAMRLSGIFGEMGRTGTGEPQGDALQQLETLAKERVEKGQSTTFAVAMDAVVQAHPQLYKQYKAERRGR